MRRGRVAQNRLYSKDRKRNIISNHDRGDRTAEEKHNAKKNRKPISPNHKSQGGRGCQNHNHKVSQAALVKTD
jgi:hypothetical protein